MLHARYALLLRETIRAFVTKYPMGQCLVNNYDLFRNGLRDTGWLRSSRSQIPVDADGAAIPWLTYGAISFLGEPVPRGCEVLDIGGGYSTVWWLKRGCHVTMVETSDKWAALVQEESSRLPSGGSLQTVEATTIAETIAALEKLRSRDFSVIVNDGIEPRSELTEAILAIAEEWTIIVWHNSDRLEYAPALDRIESSGRLRIRFRGLGPVSAYAWETTVFQNANPTWTVVGHS